MSDNRSRRPQAGNYPPIRETIVRNAYGQVVSRRFERADMPSRDVGTPGGRAQNNYAGSQYSSASRSSQEPSTYGSSQSTYSASSRILPADGPRQRPVGEQLNQWALVQSPAPMQPKTTSRRDVHESSTSGSHTVTSWLSDSDTLVGSDTESYYDGSRYPSRASSSRTPSSTSYAPGSSAYGSSESSSYVNVSSRGRRGMERQNRAAY
ncbi:hypothetical protein K445DRAFT_302732 [Daldinia sp. EC12]|nr:hypothetical protein K445DRAFT_302732 [Daldinia sp. EC12]